MTQPPPPLSSSPIPLAYDPRLPRAFSQWRRAAAFAIDVAIFAPIIAILCVAGSFDTEASHKHFSWFSVSAPFVYPIAEILLTRTPGVWILGGRFVTATGMSATYAQIIKRALWKWGPFLICALLYILVGESMGEHLIAIGIILALLIVAGFLGSYLFLLSRSLAKWHVMWFDQLAGTRLVRRA